MLSKFTLDELAALLDEPRAAIVLPICIDNLNTGHVFFWKNRWCRYESSSTYRMKDNSRVSVSYFEKDVPFLVDGKSVRRDAVISHTFWIPQYEYVLVRQHPGVMSAAEKENETGHAVYR